MEEKNFKNPEELLNFVLKECSDMNYTYNWLGNLKDYGSGKYNSTMIYLRIFAPNINFERIYFAQTLLKQYLDCKFYEIKIIFGNDELFDNERDNQFLSKLDLEKLEIDGEFNKLPQLPEKLIFLSIKTDNHVIFPELPKNLTHLCISEEGLDTDNFPELPVSLRQLEISMSPFTDKFSKYWTENHTGYPKIEDFMNNAGSGRKLLYQPAIEKVREFLKFTRTPKSTISKFKAFIHGRKEI